MRKCTFVCATVAALCLASFAQAQRADKPKDRQRERDRSALQDQNIPKPVERAIHRWYPNAKLQHVRTYQHGGVNVHAVRFTTDKGEATARITETGDVLAMGFPDVDAKKLPAPVMNMAESMFGKAPAWADKRQVSTYLINTEFGRKNFQIEMNAVGKVLDIRPQAEVREEDITQYPRATRQEEENLTPRLSQYFDKPQVKAVYRYPEADNFFWARLSTATEPDVDILLNPEREVVMYRVRTDEGKLPQAIRDTLKNLFPRAQIRSVARNEIVEYRLASPAGQDEYVWLVMTPLGDVHRVATVSSQWLGMEKEKDRDLEPEQERPRERSRNESRDQERPAR